jgi:hypothetical protein
VGRSARILETAEILHYLMGNLSLASASGAKLTFAWNLRLTLDERQVLSSRGDILASPRALGLLSPSALVLEMRRSPEP